MDDHMTMAIVDAGDDLLEEFPRLRFVELSLLDNVVEELAAGHKLHDHEDVGGGRNDLIQFDYVRMAEELQVLNLPANLSDHIQALDLLPIENLDRHFVLCDDVLADLDFAKCSI